jgi:hypothetical protein
MDEFKIDMKKKYIDFVAKPTTTQDRSYIHIPANLIKFKQVDPKKTYRVILIPLDSDES